MARILPFGNVPSTDSAPIRRVMERESFTATVAKP